MNREYIPISRLYKYRLDTINATKRAQYKIDHLDIDRFIIICTIDQNLFDNDNAWRLGENFIDKVYSVGRYINISDTYSMNTTLIEQYRILPFQLQYHYSDSLHDIDQDITDNCQLMYCLDDRKQYLLDHCIKYHNKTNTRYIIIVEHGITYLLDVIDTIKTEIDNFDYHNLEQY